MLKKLIELARAYVYRLNNAKHSNELAMQLVNKLPLRDRGVLNALLIENKPGLSQLLGHSKETKGVMTSIGIAMGNRNDRGNVLKTKSLQKQPHQDRKATTGPKL